jgi:hypothetical protein
MAIQRWDPWGSLTEMEGRMDEAMRHPLAALQANRYLQRQIR